MAAERSPIRIVGRYALYNEIAAGGMATIHLGRLLGPVGFARTVAVKRLHPQYAKDPEFVSMFLDEARLAARVQHPNVVATIDVVATDGELFLIMDYVRGESLSKILRAARKKGQHVPPRIAAAIMCGFLHGLHAAHEAKNERGEPLTLVHRDVSPQNVLVGADGIARVLDFGIAKAQGRIQVTRDGQIKGKLAYMPPEQLTGRAISRAADIYASAVVMWETLTAERLFKGDTEGETLAKILRDPVPPPSAIVPTLPLGFDAPLLKALSREVDERHATAKDLARELERCCGIASPTEVGEWVDELVGHVLDGREAQIAEIESSSVGMVAPQSVRPEVPTSDSTSDLSIPSQRAILAATRSVDTIPMGSSPDAASPSALLRGTPTTPMTPSSASNLLAPSPHGRSDQEGASIPRPLSAPTGERSFEETTGSRSRFGTLVTGTLTLPVDRRLPLFGSILGIMVLLVIVGIVVAGKFSSDAKAKQEPSGSASAPAAPTPVAAPRPSNTEREIPAPPPSEDVDPSPEGESAGDERSEPPASTTAAHATHPGPAVTSKPPTLPTPRSSVASKPTATTTPQVKKNCDPPYTIEASGRKKYKLECL